MNRRIRACAFVVAVGVFRASTAPAVELAQSGQTQCYDSNGNAVACGGTGQDGDGRHGTAWPDPRFADHGDETVTDNLTGLMWTKSAASPGVFSYFCSPASQETLTWSQALALVSCLNSQSHAGHDDWRLPNVVELQSLVHAGQSDSRAWLQTQGFTGLWLDYWSSTTHESQATPQATNYAYTVSLLDGQVGIDWKESTSYKFPAWPVRGFSNGPVKLWSTGQTTSFSSGDDGYWQRGASWPEPRFVADGECVADRLTGLTWTRNADLAAGAVGWQQALVTVAASASCGRTDWRMPNTVELRSLVHFGESDLESWLLGRGFQNVQSDDAAPYLPYWTSTTRMYQTNNAFGVRLDAATLYAFSKSAALGGLGYVWAVSDRTQTISVDDFETGDTSRWSQWVAGSTTGGRGLK